MTSACVAVSTVEPHPHPFVLHFTMQEVSNADGSRGIKVDNWTTFQRGKGMTSVHFEKKDAVDAFRLYLQTHGHVGALRAEISFAGEGLVLAGGKGASIICACKSGLVGE